MIYPANDPALIERQISSDDACAHVVTSILSFVLGCTCTVIIFAMCGGAS